MKQKIRIGTRQICIFCAALLGACASLCTSRSVKLTAFAESASIALPVPFSPEAFAEALFRQLLPALLLIFSGWLLFCGTFDTLLLTLRGAEGGYLCCGCFFLREGKGVPGVALWMLLPVVEVLAILCMNSMARLAERFMHCARKSLENADARRYLCDELFFTGLLLVLNFVRGAAFRALLK